MASFNLCDEPWIPIAGELRRRSLTEVFKDQHCPELSGNAVDKIVILRFLLCIAHASNSIPDDEAWLALTSEKLSENALAYLEKWHDRFDLYGEKPFLQFPVLAEKGGKPGSAGTLQVTVAEGNKVVLTSWNSFQSLSEAEKVVLLLRSSCYACGGKKYDNTLVLSPGVEKRTGRGGTLLGKYGYLHSYFVGDSLADTLRFNMLTEENIRSIGAFPDGLGNPFWEEMPDGEIGGRADSYLRSYQGHLFPIDKFLLFQNDGIIKTDGIVYPGHKDGLADPAVTIYMQGKDIKAVWTRIERKTWRELPSILSFLEAKTQKNPYLLAMGWSRVRQSGCRQIQIWTGGMEVSLMSGEQYLSGKNDYMESVFNFPVNVDGTQWLIHFRKLMEFLDNCSTTLFSTVNSYYKELNSDLGTAIAADACQTFWSRMSQAAQELVDLANQPEDSEIIKSKHKSWFGLLCSIYDERCPHETPRQMTAWVRSAPGNKTAKKKGTK